MRQPPRCLILKISKSRACIHHRVQYILCLTRYCMEVGGVKPRKLKHMALLPESIKAARTNLPKSREANQIANELTELFQLKCEDREEEIGALLTKPEGGARLAEFGSPLVVAGSYGRLTQGLAFRRQLVGRKLLPVYLRANAIPLFLQVVLMALDFMGFHTVRDWSRKRPKVEPPDYALFRGDRAALRWELS
jgi:hypothetical protein